MLSCILDINELITGTLLQDTPVVSSFIFIMNQKDEVTYLDWRGLAKFYKQKTGGNAMTLPMEEIYNWAIQQREIEETDDGLIFKTISEEDKELAIERELSTTYPNQF